MAEQFMVWENYGDVNPLEHGGMFVSKDKDSSNDRQFCVIQVIPNGYEDEEKWLVYDGLIDLNDSWIEWDMVRATMDTPEGAPDEYIATDVMYYYGVHTGCSDITFTKRGELIEYLQNNGIEIETEE